MRFQIGRRVAIAAALAVSACTSSGGGKTAKTGGGWFQARPLIMPAQPAKAVHSGPFESHVPTTEAAYNRLSRTQRADLVTALRGVACAHPPHLSQSADRIVCDAAAEVFLLGAPLFTADDVTGAQPIPPSTNVAGWQVSLSLNPAAADKLYQWTLGHHVTAQSGAFNDVQTSAEPPCGPTTTTLCSNFTAYISDGVVVTVPVSFAPVEKNVVISGEFDEAFARQLAHKLAS